MCTPAPLTLVCPGTPQLAYFLAPFYAAYVNEERGEISIQERLLTDPQLQSPASIDKLLHAATNIFSAEVVSYLHRYYAAADRSACDEAMACRTTVDVCLDIFHQLKEGCWSICSASSGDGAGLSGRQWPGIRDAGLGSQGGSGGAGRGGYRGRGGMRARAGRAPPETPFTSAGIHRIGMPPRTTPHRSDSSHSQRTNRHTECQQQAIAFAQGISDSVAGENLLPFSYLLEEQYAMLDPEASSTHGTLYHATRHSHLRRFQQCGVDPRIMFPHPNFFSKAPSFNLCTSAKQAISHVLYGSPTLHMHGRPCDPIILLAFRVDMASFWEHAVDQVAMEDALSRLNLEDSMWVQENLAAKGGGKMEAEDRDFVVGPWLVPLTNSGNESFMVSSYDWIRNKKQPLHVAAVSREACDWLTQSIAAVFIENEIHV
ncbi:hypothetical protein GGX14DRAFT_585714 [Mycena pura]|uniref:Uncharacterized protein n=1 Tax=Mycena pura TaxID=153505 RepID=A0AAD6VQR3_9AGAR|nr:hypothetical protein GGX14DRAFT_585714 [Mycena pura]